MCSRGAITTARDVPGEDTVGASGLYHSKVIPVVSPSASVTNRGRGSSTVLTVRRNLARSMRVEVSWLVRGAFNLSRVIPVVSPSASVTNQGYGADDRDDDGRGALSPRSGNSGGPSTLFGEWTTQGRQFLRGSANQRRWRVTSGRMSNAFLVRRDRGCVAACLYL